MDIQIYGEHMEVTDALKSHIHKKCQKFKNSLQSVRVTLKMDEQKNAVTKLNAVCPHGRDYHTTSTQKDMYASITDSINKAQRELHKNKEKPAHHEKAARMSM